jgi:2-oxoglutarate dehydrogenase E2 component (dihydrolipoamide succinyltransferase)
MSAIVLPELGVREEVRVSCWLVDPGQRVEVGDRVVEVLVRGMTFDVAAEQAGVLQRIEKPFDAPVAAGDVLGWIEETEDEA